MRYTTQKLVQLGDDLSFRHFYQIITADPDKIAAEYMEQGQSCQMSYRQYDKNVRTIAFHLAQILGAETRGRFVGLQLENSPQWPCIFWGILMAGYAPLLLDARANAATIDHLLERARAVALITAQPTQRHLLQLSTAQLLQATTEPAPEHWGDRIALCTSGTTAMSKVLVFEERNLLSNVSSGAALTELSPYMASEHSKVLMFLPMHHIFGLFVNFWYSAFGNTLVYLSERSPQVVLETARRHHITHLHCVPLLWHNLAARIQAQVRQRPKWQQWLFYALCRLGLAIQWVAPDKGQLFVMRRLFRRLHEQLFGLDITMFFSGGAYLSPNTLKFLTSIGYRMVTGFGMTEVGIVMLDDGKSLRRRLRQCAGRSFPVAEVKTATPNGKEPGELLIRGLCVANGELQGDKIVPITDEQGWFHTGDLVRLEGDYMYFLGRSKDTIVTSNGENLYPDEIEDAFRQLPGVQEYSIFGLPEQGDDLVTMVLYTGSTACAPEQEQGLVTAIQQVNRTLPLAKQVQRVFLASTSLPKTTSLKIQRQRVKEKLQTTPTAFRPLDISTVQGQSPQPQAAATVRPSADKHAAIQAQVRQLFAQVLHRPVSQITDQAHFINELGGDSLAAIELAAALQDTFDIMIADEILMQCTNVEEITAAVERLQGIATSTPVTRPKLTPLVDFAQSREYRLLASRISQAPINPYFTRHDSVVRDTSWLEGREVINLGSYNYLGLSGHPEVQKAAQEAIARLGTSASGSRLITGEKSLYRELEQEIADWKGTEDAIVLVSGHATNVTFVGNFCNQRDLILYDLLAHNSVEQGCRLSQSPTKAFAHNDIAGLEKILQQCRDQYEKVLVVVEGVYSMDGDIAPIPRFVELKKKYGLFLMVDEAHSTGVIGKTGKGVDEYFNLAPEDIDIRMGTLSKGIGSCGGYIAGTRPLIEYLRYALPGFVFSVGISPANAAAALAAIRLMRKDHSMIQRLQRIIAFFIQAAHERNLNTCLAAESAIIPILVGSDELSFLLSEEMKARGVFVPPAVYPAVPKGQARLRFCVTSEHREEQVIRALDLLLEIAAEHGIVLPGRDMADKAATTRISA